MKQYHWNLVFTEFRGNLRVATRLKLNKINLGKFSIIFRMLLLSGLIVCACSSFSYAEEVQPVQPTIKELNQTVGTREYNFAPDENVNIDSNLGTTYAGVFSIKGLDKSSNSILFNQFSGFSVSQLQTTLNISNLTIKDALSTVGSVIYNTATDASITLNNINLESNSSLSQNDVYGGAIYSRGKLTLINTNLTGNSAKSTGASTIARGGAIYSRGDVDYVADGENVEISGNYTEDSVNGKKDNAVYMASSSATLTMSAKNGGNINLQNDIDGINGYNVVLTGDGTGQIDMSGSIEHADISASNVNISFSDGQTTDHTLDNLTIGDEVNFIIDADFTNEKADTLSSENGTGTMNISDMNIIGAPTGDTAKVQVLKNAGNITLNIDKLLENVSSEVMPTMYNNSILADAVELATTTVDNDSISITGMKDVLYEMIKDREPMHMIKNFIFRTNTAYTLNQDLPETPQESILSIYNISGSDYGVINANGHSMFKLKNPITSVYLRDIVVQNASTDGEGSVAYLENNSASFATDNAIIQNNTSAGNGGAIYAKSGTVTMNDSVFTGNSSGGDGGAMYVTDDSTVELLNVDFKDNTAAGNGGAIYANKDVLITARDGSVTFEGNTANGENNGIYVGNAGATVTLSAEDNGVINLNDKISGAEFGYGVNITGTQNGEVNLNNTITDATVTLSETTLNMAHDDLMTGDNFNAQGGTLNMINNEIGNANFNTMTTSGKTNVRVDVNLEDKVMDRVNANNYENINGTINVSKMNLIRDTKRKVTRVFFADDPLRKNVTTTVKKVSSRVYNYVVRYDKSDGYFVFGRGGGGGGGGFDDYNPAVYTGNVAQHIAHMNMLANYEYAMYHSFTYMMLPKHVRDNMYKKIADSETKPQNIYDPYYNPTYVNVPEEVKSIWVRPYTTFESVPFHHGPKVTAINYGMLAGGDSDLIDIGHGFRMVYGGYMGYNGTNYHYKSISAIQQGATLGATVNIYKGNFYNTLTAGVGWEINNSDTPYGSDLLNLIMAGFSDRFGYNFEIANGKVIIQPQMTMGYTFVWMDDYRASTGAKIDIEPLHSMHFVPGIRIIGNLANGWQPYGVVNVICTFCDKTGFYADSFKLPAISLNPYVEYGLGIQKRWADKYSGFAQATVRSGGRRGAALLFGFRCMIGKLTERTAVLHGDPKPKKTLFKSKKDPDIVIESIGKEKPKRMAKEKVKQKKAKAERPKFSFRNILRKAKDKLFYRYNTDVSAKVVTDVHPDGVIMPNINGMKRKKDESLMDFKDQDRIDSMKVIHQQPEEGSGIIEVEQETDIVKTVPVVVKTVKTETKQQKVKKENNKPVVQQNTVKETKQTVKQTPVTEKPVVQKPVQQKPVQQKVTPQKPASTTQAPAKATPKAVNKPTLDKSQDVKLIYKQTTDTKPVKQYLDPVFVGQDGQPVNGQLPNPYQVNKQIVEQELDSAVQKPTVERIPDVKKPVQSVQQQTVQPVKQVQEKVTSPVAPVVQQVKEVQPVRVNKTDSIQKVTKKVNRSVYINQTKYNTVKKPSVFKDYNVEIVDFRF